MKGLVLLFIYTLMLSCGDDVLVNPDDVIVSDYTIMIEQKNSVLQGTFVDIDIDLTKSEAPIGGYSLLITYNAAALTFQGATPGELLTDCGWEYFTYRYEDFADCEFGCPRGLVYLTAIAETNNGRNHPVADCVPQKASMATLSFLVSNDRTLECQYLPIRFFWVGCTNNSLTDQTGQDLFMAAAIYDHNEANETLGEQYPNQVLPTYVGTTAECDPEVNSRIYRKITFYNGGIDLACPWMIDPYGDLNLDGLGYTIADAVMYSNYFIQGLGALVYVAEPNQYGQIPGYAASVAASDVNADGNTLTISDFVYLTRVIIGDAAPYPPVADTVSAQLTVSNSGVLTIDKTMGAALVIISGEVTPTLLAESVEMKFAFDGENTRVLVYSMDEDSFIGNFLQADSEIISVEMATHEGKPVIISDQPTN